MKQNTLLQAVIALGCGLLFGFGLILSDMVNPTRVIAFLDLFGNFDPTLAFVMAGALGVFTPLYHFVIKPRQSAILGPKDLPTKTTIDKRLILGAVLFGIGWGLAGICPGPGLVAVTTGQYEVLIFIVTMLVGMRFGRKLR